jgi:hypothetical protein
MDKATLVDDRIAEARKLVEDLNQQGRMVVSAAYWIDAFEDDGRWYLHIISPTIDEVGFTQAHIALLAMIDSRRSIHVGRDEIVLKPPDSPPVVEILDFLRRYPASEAFRYKGVYLLGHFVEKAGIYPILLDGELAPLSSFEQTVP